jgi:hypothetical protein
MERKKTACARIDHDDYIALRYSEVSRVAIEQLVDHLVEIARSTHITPNLPLARRRFLINATSIERSQPMGHLIRLLRSRRRELRLAQVIYGASTIREPALTGLVNGFVSTFFPPLLVFRLFPPDGHDDALAWVLANNDGEES